MLRFSRLRDVVGFVAASLISYYGYANSFSDSSCRHPNSEWLQRRFLSPPKLCRSLSQARCKQFWVSFSQPLFFLQQHELPYHVFRCRCLPHFLIFVLLILFIYFSFTMARIQTRAQQLAARRALSQPVRDVGHRARSVSSSTPRTVARRARTASSAPAMAPGAQKTVSFSGRKAKTTSICAGARRARTPPVVFPVSEPKSLGQKATSPVVGTSADKEPSASAGPAGPASEPPSLVQLLCLRCAKYAAKNLSSVCSFDKESSDKCSRCCAQKSKCLPVSISFSLPISLLIWIAPPLPGLTWSSAPALPVPAGGD